MKRFLSLFLALLMILSLIGGSSVFAEELEGAESPSELTQSEEPSVPAPNEGEDSAEGGDPLEGEDPAEGGDPIEGEDPAEGGDPIEGEDPAEGGDPIKGEDPAEGEDPESSEEPPLTMLLGAGSPSEPPYAKANGFVAGQKYIIGSLSSDGTKITVLSIANSGSVTFSAKEIVLSEGKVLATDVTEDMIWVASSTDNKKYGLKNDSTSLYLYMGGGDVASKDTEKANWVYTTDSLLSYNSNSTAYMAYTTSFAMPSTAPAAGNIVIFTDGAELGTGGTVSSSGSGSGSGSGTSVEFSKAEKGTKPTDATYLALDAAKTATFGVAHGELSIAASTIKNDKLTVTTGNCLQAKTQGSGFSLFTEDPPGEFTYLYVTEQGTLNKSKGSQPSGYWNLSKKILSYTIVKEDSEITWYLSGATSSALSFSTSKPAEGICDVTLYTGTSAPSKGNGGGGSSSTTDAEAPTFTTQPSGHAWVKPSQAGNVEFTVEAEVPEGSEATNENIEYQWYVDGEKIAGATEKTYSLTRGEECGAHCVYCTASITTGKADALETHTATSTYAGYIVAKGQTKDIMLFSDIHEEQDKIADVLNGYITESNGYLPGMVLATGDYNNNNKTEAQTILNVNSVKAMLGGLPVILLAGNHENGNYIVDMNTLISGNSYLGEDVIIYIINYSDISSSSYSSINEQLKTFLGSLSENEKRPVIILGHAGLHVTSTSWSGGASYNIDSSDQVVDTLNKYGRNLDIFYFFGHNHSKVSTQFYKTTGESLTFTNTYDSKLDREITLNFTYGHMGYLNSKIQGSENGTIFSSDGEGNITLSRIKKSGYTGETIVAAPGTLKVPTVSALAATVKAGEEVKVNVTTKEKYTCQWYISPSDSSITSGSFKEIKDATKSSYTPTEDDVGKYIYCKVTIKGSIAFATTTAAKVESANPAPDEPEPPVSGGQVIVMQSGEKYYALVCDTSNGTLSAAEVKVKDGKVVGPVKNNYLWEMTGTESTVKNLGTNNYILTTGKNKGATAIQATTSATTKFNYDSSINLLYIKGNGSGGTSKYYYPSVSSGSFTTASVTDLATAAAVSIYLMDVVNDTETEYSVNYPDTVKQSEKLTEALKKQAEKYVKDHNTGDIAEALQAGKNIIVDISMKETKKQDVSGNDISKISSLLDSKFGAGKASVLKYFDIKVTLKTEDGKELATLSETDELIPFIIVLAENETGSLKSYVYIARIHNGVAELLDASKTKDGIAFESGKFSTYALVTSDEKPISNKDKNSSGSETSKLPDTGDHSTPILWLALIVLCLAATVIFVVPTRKKRNH